MKLLPLLLLAFILSLGVSCSSEPAPEPTLAPEPTAMSTSTPTYTPATALIPTFVTQLVATPTLTPSTILSQTPAPKPKPTATLTTASTPLPTPTTTPVPTASPQPCPGIHDTPKTPGIYNHRVESATSADGLNFTPGGRVLLEHASVPDGIRRPDGKVWVYYVNGHPGQHAIFIAERQQDGSLKPIDCVRIDGSVEGNAVDPDIVLRPDGSYQLFYFTGWFVGPKPPPGPRNHNIYTAVSEDGIHFKQASLAIQVSTGGTDPTSVRLEDGSWLMAIAHPEGILLARSDDGLTFSLTDQSFPEGGPEFWRFPDRVRLYIKKAQNLLIYVTTDGGASWNLEHSTSIRGHDPSMVQEADGSYTLYIKTFDLPAATPRHTKPQGQRLQ